MIKIRLFLRRLISRSEGQDSLRFLGKAENGMGKRGAAGCFSLKLILVFG